MCAVLFEQNWGSELFPKWTNKIVKVYFFFTTLEPDNKLF